MQQVGARFEVARRRQPTSNDAEARGGAEPSAGYGGARQTGFVQLENGRFAGRDAKGTVRPCLWLADEARVAESRDHAARVSS